MNFHLITLFPEAFSSYLSESILSRAQKEKKISVKFYNPRDFVKPTKSQKKNEKPYLRIDDRPYGGGPGMVMQALPVIKAIEKAVGRIKNKKKVKMIFLAPGGTQFNTEYAKNTAKKYSDVVIVCGRYEGIDARIKKAFPMEDISVGPFVLTGGELPAMIIVDCMSRQIEGVLGNFSSLEETRVSSNDVYTRPEVFDYKGKKYSVPKVLLGGNHKEIEEWRKNE
ncbi:MAG: tRNA (guanosine(37)-N1)-methyltransferase TrmD [Candidatus Paceibacterota bacterium]|jgi:tRNA (guanine37-N1)-methyltransferase